MRFILTALAFAALAAPLSAQYYEDRYGRDRRDARQYGYGYHERDPRNGSQGFLDLRRGITLTGYGELREDRFRAPVSRIFAREARQGELRLTLDTRGRDQFARAIVRKWKSDKIEAELTEFNGAPARGKVKIEFDDRRGYFEKAEINGKSYGGDIRLKFRR